MAQINQVTKFLLLVTFVKRELIFTNGQSPKPSAVSFAIPQSFVVFAEISISLLMIKRPNAIKRSKIFVQNGSEKESYG